MLICHLVRYWYGLIYLFVRPGIAALEAPYVSRLALVISIVFPLTIAFWSLGDEPHRPTSDVCSELHLETGLVVVCLLFVWCSIKSKKRFDYLGENISYIYGSIMNAYFIVFEKVAPASGCKGKEPNCDRNFRNPRRDIHLAQVKEASRRYPNL